MKVILVCLALICTYLPYGCDADCNCLDIARYRHAQWEWLLESELDLGADPDSPTIYYLGGCCAAYRELIECLERSQGIR
jgi:hypothetical protein